MKKKTDLIRIIVIVVDLAAHLKAVSTEKPVKEHSLSRWRKGDRQYIKCHLTEIRPSMISVAKRIDLKMYSLIESSGIIITIVT